MFLYFQTYNQISNFDYLLCLSYFAGRMFNSPLHHPTLPWVINFTNSSGSGKQSTVYRDLSKTKYRLTKGDVQLDQTYNIGDHPQENQVRCSYLYKKIYSYFYKFL